MKKALIVTTLGKQINNGHNYMIQPLKSLGYQVSWAANFDNLDLNTIKIDKVDICFSRNPLSIKNLFAYFRLRKHLKDVNYDLIHCNTPVASFVARVASKKIIKLTGMKVIYTPHGFHFYKGSGIKGFLIKFIEKYLAKFTDAIIVMNEEDYRNAKLFNDKTVVYKISGVGVDTPSRDNIFGNKKSIRDELNLSKSSNLLVSIGEINKNKNHLMVLKALNTLKDYPIDYIICGVGPLEKKIKKYISNNNLDNVHLLGYRIDVFDILNESDIFVQSSYREGLPRSIIEAMSCGLPCVVTDIRGNKDLVNNDENGFRVQLNNYQTLSRILILLINNKNSYIKMSYNNTKKAKKYSFLNVKLEMIEIYNNIIGK